MKRSVNLLRGDFLAERVERVSHSNGTGRTLPWSRRLEKRNPKCRKFARVPATGRHQTEGQGGKVPRRWKEKTRQPELS